MKNFPEIIDLRPGRPSVPGSVGSARSSARSCGLVSVIAVELLGVVPVSGIRGSGHGDLGEARENTGAAPLCAGAAPGGSVGDDLAAGEQLVVLRTPLVAVVEQGVGVHRDDVHAIQRTALVDR